MRSLILICVIWVYAVVCVDVTQFEDFELHPRHARMHHHHRHHRVAHHHEKLPEEHDTRSEERFMQTTVTAGFCPAAIVTTCAPGAGCVLQANLRKQKIIPNPGNGDLETFCVDTYNSCTAPPAILECEWRQTDQFLYDNTVACNCAAPAAGANPPKRKWTMTDMNAVLATSDFLTLENVIGTFGLNSITWQANNGGEALVQTALNPHNLQPGTSVTIAGTNTAGFHGRFRITGVPNPDEFTYAMAVSPGGPSNAGTYTLMDVDALPDPATFSANAVLAWQAESERTPTSAVIANGNMKFTFASSHNCEIGDFVKLMGWNAPYVTGWYEVMDVSDKSLSIKQQGTNPIGGAGSVHCNAFAGYGLLRGRLARRWVSIQKEIGRLPVATSMPTTASCRADYLQQYILRFVYPFAQSFFCQMWDYNDAKGNNFADELLESKAWSETFWSFLKDDLMPLALLLHPGWPNRLVQQTLDWTVNANRDFVMGSHRTQGFIWYMQELLDNAFADIANNQLATFSNGYNNNVSPTSLVVSGSDPHHGRRVCFLTFEGSKPGTFGTKYSSFKVVYKPRDILLDDAITGAAGSILLDFGTWCDNAINGGNLAGAALTAVQTLKALLPFDTYTFVNVNQDHGWVGFVDDDQRSISNDGIGRYLQRSGAMFALLEAFGFIDIHMGNIFRAKEMPVLVDVEILSPSRDIAFEDAMTLNSEADNAFGFVIEEDSVQKNKLVSKVNPKTPQLTLFDTNINAFLAGYNAAVMVMIDQHASVTAKINNALDPVANPPVARVLPLSTGPQKDRVNRMLDDKTFTSFAGLLKEALLNTVTGDEFGPFDAFSSSLIKDTMQQLVYLDVPAFRTKTNVQTLTQIQTVTSANIVALHRAMAAHYLQNGDLEEGWFLGVDQATIPNYVSGGNLPQQLSDFHTQVGQIFANMIANAVGPTGGAVNGGKWLRKSLDQNFWYYGWYRFV